VHWILILYLYLLLFGDIILINQGILYTPTLYQYFVFTPANLKSTLAVSNLLALTTAPTYSHLNIADIAAMHFISPNYTSMQTFIADFSQINTTHILLSPALEYIYRTIINDYSVVSIEIFFILTLFLLHLFIFKKVVIMF
jgi:hypothetical protein